jgi:hypothetical protein
MYDSPMGTRSRTRKFLTFLSMALPFILPALVLAFWLAGRCGGQDTEPLHIMASMDPDGGHTTTFSTILADGADAVWTCSAGTFLETGTSEAGGRTVTWQPEADLEDSVMVVITTPSLSDTVRFLPIVPETIPGVTVSAAYHLALLERSRSVQLPPGGYVAAASGEGLRCYDGLVILIVQTAGVPRTAYGMLPGDSLGISLPLGGTVTAVGIDNVDEALDNAGIIHVTFLLTDSMTTALPDPVALDATMTEDGPINLDGEAEITAIRPEVTSLSDALPLPVVFLSTSAGPRIAALIPGVSSIAAGPSDAGSSQLPEYAPVDVLLMSGTPPADMVNSAGLRIAGRTPGTTLEHAPSGIYFTAGDPGAWKAAFTLSRAGLGDLKPVLTMLTVREDEAGAFSTWLADLDPASTAVTAVVVESEASVARGAAWIRSYSIYAAGDAASTGLPSGFTGDSLPGVPARRGGEAYSVVVIP